MLWENSSVVVAAAAAVAAARAATDAAREAARKGLTVDQVLMRQKARSPARKKLGQLSRRTEFVPAIGRREAALYRDEHAHMPRSISPPRAGEG